MASKKQVKSATSESSGLAKAFGKTEKAKNENSQRPDGNFLAKYFREMAALDVFKPEQEFGKARRIERLETEAWVALLSYASASAYVLSFLSEKTRDSETPLDFRAIKRAATLAKKHSIKSSREALRRAASKLAPTIQSMDSDHLWLDELVSALQGLSIRGGSSKSLGFSPRSKAFATYLGEVRAANASAEMARNDFVRANLRLVVSIARRFNNGRMSLADLIQEGNIGLMKAVDRYDYRRGFRFSTYASWWIRHAISRALADKGREVRLPVHMIDAHHRLTKARRELSAKLGRDPTAVELADAAGIPAHKIEKMRTYLIDKKFSLDKPVNEEDGRQLGEMLSDPDWRDRHPADLLNTSAMSREVLSLLKELKPIEADILSQRFGLSDDKEHTLKQIGEKYNLSRERIRQLQEQALDKMRRALERKSMMA